MRRAMSLLLGAAMAAAVLSPTVALGASAQQGQESARLAKKQRYTYDLDPVPHDPARDGGSQVSGKARVTVDGDQVTVRLRARGLSPNLVHVQHIHGVGQNECPTAEARNDRVDDGLIDTVEGLPDYGAIQVSLTTRGDTGPGSGLAVERFPMADEHGKLTYERTFTIGADFPREVAENLERHHFVVHGIDVNHNGAYDFDAGVSGLTSSLPLEAELPATCGLTKHDHDQDGSDQDRNNRNGDDRGQDRDRGNQDRDNRGQSAPRGCAFGNDQANGQTMEAPGCEVAADAMDMDEQEDKDKHEDGDRHEVQDRDKHEDNDKDRGNGSGQGNANGQGNGGGRHR